MLPTELIYVLAALGVGVVLYRYFSGHGGVQVSRQELGSLPPEGEIPVRGSVVRWRSAEDGSFVAGWPIASGQVVAMNVTFDAGRADADSDADADQGVLELKADRRFLARGVRWTDEIRDRTLRADVEAILKALAREARGGRTEKRRIASAKPVSDERRLDS